MTGYNLKVLNLDNVLYDENLDLFQIKRLYQVSELQHMLLREKIL